MTKLPSPLDEEKGQKSQWPGLADLREAVKLGTISGLAGASAMIIQVGVLMPLDTTITVQYRYGSSGFEAARQLFATGGFRRFYSGVAPALVQGPLARFGDTCANAGVLRVLDSAESTARAPTLVKTTAASALAASWRVVLMPIDVCKTVFQIYGQTAMARLSKRAARHGIGGFYFGSAAAFTSGFAGHLPWYTTFNELDRTLPQGISTSQRLVRHAVLGFSASFVSDTITNALRVIKAIRQAEGMTYADAIRSVVQRDGVLGLVTRGLKTRLILNGVQGVFFTIVWKTLEQSYYTATTKEREL